KPQAFTFFPPAPDTPRLQFLTGFAKESDLRGGSDSFATFVAGKPPASKPITKPYGVALHKGKIFVVDTVLACLEVVDLEKRQMRYWIPQGEGRLRMPINVCVDKDGTRYVTDTIRRQVLIYGADESYLGAIGENLAVAPVRDSETGTPQANTNAWKPVDVLVTQDRIMVTDITSQSVKVYNKADRQLLFSVPAGGSNDTNKLFQPTNLAVDSQGRIYVSDTGGFRVQQYDASGKFLRTIGEQGIVPGSFALPKGIAVDREDRLYVVDAATQVVQIFDPQGRLLMYFGEPNKSAAGLNLPAKVVVDYDHVSHFQKYAAPNFVLEYLVIVTNQYGERKVSVYGFGHPRS
ncbi:MAG TPA: 6-bladed beta-propeller, partial [Bacillota bacterium]|nr:6-bladed beta-propeller [Bacillota bacterium]